MEELQVSGQARAGRVDELSLLLHLDGRIVPGVLWRPASSSTAPVVLLGHGGSGHKRIERHVRMAAWFADHAGIASLSIDGPFHGDRAVDGDGPLDYQKRVVREGAVDVHDRMRRDWLDTLAAVELAGWVDGQNVAFIGTSMGTRYGLPVCADLASRLRCAVIAKFGVTQTDQLPHGLAAIDTITAAAENISAPILQHVQWHDEVFPLQGQLDLFEIFTSTDKQLRARAGAHTLTRPDDEIAWREYVATHLNASEISTTPLP